MSESSRDVTHSLAAHIAGEPDAVSELIPLVYEELRALAAAYMQGERHELLLTPTALVHEAYLRLVDTSRIDWKGKTHFLAVAAVQMRRVLVDYARARKTRKRGGDHLRVTLDEAVTLKPGISLDVLALNEALEKLAHLSPRQGRVVELRFFGGLSVKEAAFLLDISERTVKEDWRMARAWLMRELG